VSRIARLLGCTFAAVALTAAPARAVLNFQPSGFTTDLVASNLPFATGIAFAPDGRIFIALKSGVVRVWDGSLLPTPFVDLSAQVNDAHDRGLLGIAVHPQFPASPYVYLLFTHDPAGVTADNDAGGRVSRLVRVEADPAQGYQVALPGSQLPQTTPGGPGHWVMLGKNSTLANIGNTTNGRDTTKPSCMVGFSMANAPVEDCIPADENSHTIGTVAFASDGSLFISSGDGSNYTAVDPRALRAQILDSLAGKILRIDPATALGLPDNPFYDAAQPGRNRSKVWARGVRNPFRTTIHPLTSDAYIGDVGWNTWEEANTGKGANFGWPCYEGGTQSGVESGLTASLRQSGYETSSSTSAACATLYAQGLSAVKTPTFAYSHGGTDGYGSTGGASAQAGAFYTGTTYPAQFRNALFIADYSRRWIRYLRFDVQGVATVANFALESATGITQVVQGPDTNLYAVIYSATGSQVRRIRYTAGGNTPPTAVASANPSSGSLPLVVTFSALGTYDPDAQPLGFSWSFGDGGSSTLENPGHTYTASGTYTATLTVSEQTAPFASSAEDVVITVGAVPPVGVISSPADGALFSIGDVVTYAGSASAGGFPLPPGALSWQLREHHNEHLHFTGLPGAGGSFSVTDHADGVSLEICLTATDQTLTDTQCVDLLPRQTTVDIASSPPGMHIVYEEEGVALPTPAIVRPTRGSVRTLNAPAVEQWRSFDRWSDGLTALSRQFTVGATPLSFRADYVNHPPLASAGASVGSGAGRLSVAFNTVGSSDPEGGALATAWSFGDGQNGSGPAPTHAYAAPGSYVATLTVTDPIGGTDSDTVAVSIPNGAPTASFTMTPTIGGTPLTVFFDAGASTDPDGDALAYAWNFGDGQTATGAQVSHVYAAVGGHVATLGVSDPFLATDSAQGGVTVVSQPGPQSGCGIGPELVVAMSALLWLRRSRAR
jgi:PKD repeat protein/glucose/arabinose dehydrogenase